MSGRTTRSRSAKISATMETQQPKILDIFQVGKSRARSRAKNIKESVLEPTANILGAKGSPPKQPKKDITNVPETSANGISKDCSREPSPLRRKAALPIAVENTKSTARKMLFGPSEPSKESNSSDQPCPSNAVVDAKTSEAIPCPFGEIEAPEKPKRKIRTVADLQAELASKGAARIHNQNIASKSKQVNNHAQLLSSPVKVPTGNAKSHFPPPSPLKKLISQNALSTKSPMKSIAKVTSAESSKDEAGIPEYVLPTFKTPLKEQDSDEEREMNEKNRVFQYGMASRLVEAVKNGAELPIPAKYQHLLELFQRCDRIVSIYFGQGHRCPLLKIQRDVQRNSKKEFTLRHLAQIRALYPSSYIITVEEQWDAFGGKTAGKYEHVITPNIKDDLKEFMMDGVDTYSSENSDDLPLVEPGKCLSPMKSPKKKVIPLSRAPEIDSRPKLEGWRMNNRSHVMRYHLVERVKKAYLSFMERFGGKTPTSFTRFHPKFIARIEDECQDIEQADLPALPRKDPTLSTMRSFMDTVDVSIALPKAVDTAISELKSPVKAIISSSNNVPLSPRKFAQTQAMKGKGAKSLLERIREKEAAKKAAEACRDPEAERRQAMLERLHKHLLRSILNIFAQRQCRSVELSVLLEKLEYTCRSEGKMTRITKSEIQSHIELLSSALPEMCSLVQIVGRRYVQIESSCHDQIRTAIKLELEKTPQPVPFP